jgi:hypothetical protein
MFKNLIFSIVIVISFMAALVGMEPNICPKFNTSDDVNSFLFQLKKTGRNYFVDKSFQYQGNTWIIPYDSYTMLNDSILP